MANSRQHPRIPKVCPVTYQHLGPDGPEGEPRQAETVDLSEGGLCLQTAEELAVGDLLFLELRPEPDAAPIPAHARVAWSRPTEHCFSCGVKFEWILTSPLAMDSFAVAPAAHWLI